MLANAIRFFRGQNGNKKYFQISPHNYHIDITAKCRSFLTRQEHLKKKISDTNEYESELNANLRGLFEACRGQIKTVGCPLLLEHSYVIHMGEETATKF